MRPNAEPAFMMWMQKAEQGKAVNIEGKPGQAFNTKPTLPTTDSAIVEKNGHYVVMLRDVKS